MLNYSSGLRFVYLSIFATVGLLCVGTGQSKEVPLQFSVNFPSQGMKIGAEGEIQVAEVLSATGWASGTLEIDQVDANREFNPASDVKSLILQRTKPVGFIQDGTYALPIKVTAEGEFGLVVKLTVTNAAGKKSSFRVAVSVLAENGEVWFGLGSVTDAAANRAARQAGFAKFAQGGAPLPAAAQASLEQWEQDRQRRLLERKAQGTH